MFESQWLGAANLWFPIIKSQQITIWPQLLITYYLGYSGNESQVMQEGISARDLWEMFLKCLCTNSLGTIPVYFGNGFSSRKWWQLFPNLRAWSTYVIYIGSTSCGLWIKSLEPAGAKSAWCGDWYDESSLNRLFTVDFLRIAICSQNVVKTW